MNKRYKFAKEEMDELVAPRPNTRYARILFDRKDIPKANLSLAMFRYEPGQVGPAHSHQEEVEVYFMLKGEGEVDLSGETYKLTPGSALYIPPKTRHKTRNSGDEDMEFLAVFAPAMDFDDIRENWNKIEF